jgi:hypothetical protein
MFNVANKNIKIYETSWSAPIILCLSASVIGISVGSLSRPVSEEWISWMYLILLLLAAIDMKFGFYSFIENGTLSERRHFFFLRHIKMSEVDQIMYQPTWILGQSLRSLYFVDKSSQKITIKLANAAYSTKVLASIVKEAESQNPAIFVDVPARELASKYN